MPDELRFVPVEEIAEVVQPSRLEQVKRIGRGVISVTRGVGGITRGIFRTVRRTMAQQPQTPAGTFVGIRGTRNLTSAEKRVNRTGLKAGLMENTARLEQLQEDKRLNKAQKRKESSERFRRFVGIGSSMPSAIITPTSLLPLQSQKRLCPCPPKKGIDLSWIMGKKKVDTVKQEKQRNFFNKVILGRR